MSWSCLVSFSFGKNDFINATSPCIFLCVFLLASASTNLSTSSSVRDTNLSLAEFLVIFFWCTARGHRNLLVVISF